MRGNLFVLTILAVVPSLAFAQTDAGGATQNTKSAKQRNHTTITGCLTGTKKQEYRLKDEKGVTNLLYSNNIDLDTYVGKMITVTGDQSPKPSTDTGTGRPMPVFRVLDVQPASGTCK